MCGIVERVYISTGGHRSKSEEVFPCEKAWDGKLCPNTKRRITEYHMEKQQVQRNDTVQLPPDDGVQKEIKAELTVDIGHKKKSVSSIGRKRSEAPPIGRKLAAGLPSTLPGPDDQTRIPVPGNLKGSISREALEADHPKLIVSQQTQDESSSNLVHGSTFHHEQVRDTMPLQSNSASVRPSGADSVVLSPGSFPTHVGLELRHDRRPSFSRPLTAPFNNPPLDSDNPFAELSPQRVVVHQGHWDAREMNETPFITQIADGRYIVQSQDPAVIRGSTYRDIESTTLRRLELQIIHLEAERVCDQEAARRLLANSERVAQFQQERIAELEKRISTLASENMNNGELARISQQQLDQLAKLMDRLEERISLLSSGQTRKEEAPHEIRQKLFDQVSQLEKQVSELKAERAQLMKRNSDVESEQTRKDRAAMEQQHIELHRSRHLVKQLQEVEQDRDMWKTMEEAHSKSMYTEAIWKWVLNALPIAILCLQLIAWKTYTIQQKLLRRNIRWSIETSRSTEPLAIINNHHESSSRRRAYLYLFVLLQIGVQIPKESACVVLAILSKCLEPPLQPGYTRLRWQCRCGDQLFGDCFEYEEGGVAKLVERMQRSFGARVFATSRDERPLSSKYISRVRYPLWLVFRLLTAILRRFGPSPPKLPQKRDLDEMLICSPSSSSDQVHTGRPRQLFQGIRQTLSAFVGGSSKPPPGLPQHRTPGTIVPGTRADISPMQPQQTLHLMACMQRGRYRKIIHQDRIETITTDQELFAFMQQQIARYRGVIRKLFSFKCIQAIYFVKFRLRACGSAEVRNHEPCCTSSVPRLCECIPPAPKVEPAPDAEYRCAPAGPLDTWPPVLSEELMHMLTSPQCIDPKETFVLQQLPKRTKGELKGSVGQPAEGWGIHFQEGWDFDLLIGIVLSVFLVASLLFAILWSHFKLDVQGAFGVSSYMVTATGIFVAWFANRAGKMG